MEALPPENGVLVWSEVKRYLDKELRQVQALMDTAEGPKLHQLQGESQRIKKCLNMPTALEIERQQAKEEEQRGSQRIN